MIEKKAQGCKVLIFGHEYSLVTTESEDHIVQSARHVDAIMQEIASHAVVTDERKIAVLAALRIASKVLKLEEDIANNVAKQDLISAKIDHELRLAFAKSGQKETLYIKSLD
ncbi:MAG TPA: cell division protein ZapA [Candidatus Babeliales bacterium]|nr:cell division protein ZapA [Candidatus Babeliales bacterium]